MGNLHIVATPIGNLQDVTLRAAKTILESKILITESTSKAGILLKFLTDSFPHISSNEKRIISLTEDEEENKLSTVLEALAENDAVLISEAGTPLVSDPGYKLVRSAISRGINIISIPGPTAAISALVSSGLPTDKFIFIGYPPKKGGKKSQVFRALKEIPAEIRSTVILYESPHRLIETLLAISEVFGNIEIVIARELTKIHEEIRREKISESISHFEKNAPRGEFTVLF